MSGITAATADLIRQGTEHAFIDGSLAVDPLYAPDFVFNDWRSGKKVISLIERELDCCVEFCFSVAFVTLGGITPLLLTLKELEVKGVRGRVLTTDYLQFSDPKALEKLNSFSNIEVRMFTMDDLLPESIGFHSKGYLFKRVDGSYRVLIGSSNLTGAALSRNKEWNLAVSSLSEGAFVGEIVSEFERMWESSSTLASVIDIYRSAYSDKNKNSFWNKSFSYKEESLKPNAMQAAFMSNLDELINSGESRALLVSATGTGKTYASAFALRHLQPKRILFLLHREQVLRSAMRSYRRVFGNSKSLGLLSGTSDESDRDFVFATIQTLSRDDVLMLFDPCDFDIIVIDEVHRAGAMSYQKVMSYFCPQLWLGMTASPDRPDGFDIYGLFDNNIAQEIRLNQALEYDLLCPFHYFGISDVTVNGQALEEDAAFSMLTSNERLTHILNQAEYFGYSGDRVKGLVFCRNKEEARTLSGMMNERGYCTLALTGEDPQNVREYAVERLVAKPGMRAYNERLDYILTVDIFNEGIDIPDINQVIMLRPTISPIIFIQQLGRGLRKAEGKDFVVVIDFIGNYNNNYFIPIALSGDRSYNKDNIRRFLIEGEKTIPGISSVHFDEISRDKIFRSIDASSTGYRLFKEKYLALKHKIAHIPTMVDFYEYGELDPSLIVNDARFRSYYRFLEKVDCDLVFNLTEREHLVIEFVSRYLTSGLRWQEIEIMSQLLQKGEANKKTVGECSREYCNLALKDAAWESAVRVLSKSFIKSPSEVSRYGDFAIIDFKTLDLISTSEELAGMLGNHHFRDALSDVIEFSRRKYLERELVDRYGFELYGKYSRKDVCRLLNWAQDDSSTVYGYRIKYGTCPIFVTYNKSGDISLSTQYEDRFVNRHEFSWMTRSKVSLHSAEVRMLTNAQNNGLLVLLFVKRSDGEGSDFYYLGPVQPCNPCQTTIRNDQGQELPIVNFRLLLETPVREDIYDYLIG